MNLRATKFRVVEGQGAKAFEAALAAAKMGIVAANENAQFVDVKVVVEGGILYGVLVWAG